MKKLLLIFLFAFFFSPFAFTQNDSSGCNLQISLLTCAPGEELYASFGHTALRVQDRSAGTDFVFNYGTFEFSPDFNIKFIRGKLRYSLSVEDFNDFLYTYQVESRSVEEQVIDLSCAEKQKLYSALQVNAQEQNRYYKYDFLFDNCTTRAGDMIVKNHQGSVSFKNILPAQTPSFRTLIHSYLNAGHQYWSKLGIDILLGARLDKKVTNRQAMFLPDWLMKGIDSASANNHPIVQSKHTLLKMPSPLKNSALFRPGFVFSLLVLVTLILSFIQRKWARASLRIFDFLFFFILGLAGLLLLFMWFGTDHKVCRDNFNLLWALPTHVVMAFLVHSRRPWVITYYRAVCGITVCLAVAWFMLPQQMNNALLPVILLIIFRSWQIAKTDRYAGKNNRS